MKSPSVVPRDEIVREREDQCNLSSLGGGEMARSPLARNPVYHATAQLPAVCHYGWPHFIYNNWLETVTWFWLKVGTVWNL